MPEYNAVCSVDIKSVLRILDTPRSSSTLSFLLGQLIPFVFFFLVLGTKVRENVRRDQPRGPNEGERMIGIDWIIRKLTNQEPARADLQIKTLIFEQDFESLQKNLAY